LLLVRQVQLIKRACQVNMAIQKQPQSRSIHPMKVKVAKSAAMVAIMAMMAITNIYGNRGLRNEATIARTEQSIMDWTKSFCQSWYASDANNRSLQPFDLWHTHHPNWIVTRETEDEFCVGAEIADKSPIIRNMMHFYTNQFLSSCRLCMQGINGVPVGMPIFGTLILGLFMPSTTACRAS
jgi:hypothetical protein